MSKGPYVGVFRQAAGAWIVLAIAWGVVVIGALLWLAGGIATWLMGHGLNGPAFDFQMGEDLFLKGPSYLWPQAPVWLVFTIFALELVGLGIPVTIVVVNLVRRQLSENDPLNSLAADKHLEHLAPEGIRERALALRPDLSELLSSARDRKALPLKEAGVPLGMLRPGGTELRASWEDVAVAIMAPRSGKTTAIAIPAILDAPGAALVTSNKADVWAATWEIRERETGQRTWLFDPQGITHMPQTWWWNPLRGVNSFDTALRLAMHFMQEVEQDESGDEAFWVSAASDVLTALLLAAGIKEGGTLYDVYDWLSDPGDPEPVDILNRAGDNATASSLRARQTSADDTREGIYEYARTACRCLRSPEIMRWVVPPGTPLRGLTNDDRSLGNVGLQELGGDIEFRPVGFAASRQTMYLLSKDGAASAAPLVAALTDRIMVEATRDAERRYRGRLDPPMVICLDEAANICKIADLPMLYSHMGSRGIFLLTILQSRPQARQVWGEGFDTLWSAATIKIIGAGIDDPDLADDISRLVGDHDITVRSVSQGAGGSYSESVALRREAIMSTSDVRAMAKGTAVLLATGALPASIKLLPWYEGPRAEEIRKATRFAQETMETAARPAPMELVTVNTGNGDDTVVDLRKTGPKVRLDKTPPDTTAEHEPWRPVGPPPPIDQPGSTLVDPVTAPSATIISQDGEVLGETGAERTRDLSAEITAARRDPNGSSGSRPPGTKRRGRPKER